MNQIKPSDPGSELSACPSKATPTTRRTTLCLSPKSALQLFDDVLTMEERQDILHYSKIYYFSLGKSAPGEIARPLPAECFPHGSTIYMPKPGGHIAFRYEMEKLIGKGSFANVVRAYDHKEGKQVALKIVRNEPRYQELLEREITILQYLRKQDPTNQINVIHLLDQFCFHQHQILAFELLSTNLFELNRKNQFRGFRPTLARKFAHEILIALEALYVNGIIHADLKPENILLKKRTRSGLKIIDFGWSSFQDEKPLSSYLQSRFYRAPEVILGGPYTTAIDMWSFGAILAEMITGFPLFAGEDKEDQLSVMMECLGVPQTDFLKQCRYKDKYFSQRGYPFYCIVAEDEDCGCHMAALAGSYTKSSRKFRGPPGSKALRTILRQHLDESLVDLMHRCMEWDPEKRLKPSEALNHKWVLGQDRQDAIKAHAPTNQKQV